MRTYWNFSFCENDVNGLVKCYDNGENHVGYRLLWERLGDYRSRSFKDLESPGIYLLFEKRARESKPRMYVGQGDLRRNKKGMLNRVKEHVRKGDMNWCDEVIFLPVRDFFGATELKWLEHRFYVEAEGRGRYQMANGTEPQDAKLRDEIKPDAEEFVENAHFLTAALGFTPFPSNLCRQETRLDVQDKPTPSPKIAFTVKFAGGKSIACSSVAETFAAAIRAIGSDKVSTLDLQRDKKPLLMKNKADMPYPSSARDVGMGWFVNVHASRSANIKTLRNIIKLLDVDASILE